MKIFTQIIGNIHDPEWHDKLRDAQIESLNLDQWTAQKSRFVIHTAQGNNYAVSLKRHAQLLDGDLLAYDASKNRAIMLRIKLSEVLVIDLGELLHLQPQTMIRRAVELGHALGNQHWPAVIQSSKVYVPLTVDRKVMESVMQTHHFEQIHYHFEAGEQIIPYLAPHEIRRLFGGTASQGHVHPQVQEQ